MENTVSRLSLLREILKFGDNIVTYEKPVRIVSPVAFTTSDDRSFYCENVIEKYWQNAKDNIKYVKEAVYKINLKPTSPFFSQLFAVNSLYTSDFFSMIGNERETSFMMHEEFKFIMANYIRKNCCYVVSEKFDNIFECKIKKTIKIFNVEYNVVRLSCNNTNDIKVYYKKNWYSWKTCILETNQMYKYSVSFMVVYEIFCDLELHKNLGIEFFIARYPEVVEKLKQNNKKLCQM